MDFEIGYGQKSLNTRIPMEEFSYEDSELLRSVLSSHNDQFINYTYNDYNNMFNKTSLDCTRRTLKDTYSSPFPPPITLINHNNNTNYSNTHSNDESSNSSSLQNEASNISPHKQKLDKDNQTFEWRYVMDKSNGKLDINDPIDQKNKRRESQNRASRKYRQRKKAYIKEIEEKLNKLQLENERLREENLENQKTLERIRRMKPAPLLRSFSSELQNNDKEIEKILKELEKAASDPSSSDEEVRSLLNKFHEYSSKREHILKEDILQLTEPKLQEKLIKVDHMISSKEIDGIDQLLNCITNETSKDQQSRIISLCHEYVLRRTEIWNERAKINQDIKTFYQEKIESERITTSKKHEKTSNYETLGEKLQNLKKNLMKEEELNKEVSNEFSKILTPYQEAIITVNHYRIYGENSTTIQILHNIWKIMVDERNSSQSI